MLFISHGQANEDDQYSYQDLLKIQSILLDSYPSDSNQSMAISLANVSYKIAENLIQSFSDSNNPSLIKDAIDSLDISISIIPENKGYYLLKGDLYYLIREYDAFYLDAIRAYENSGGEILESKRSFVSLIDLYANQELYSDAFLLISKMLFLDSPWLLNEFFDMSITLTMLSNNQSVMLEAIESLEDQYTVEIPNIYLAKSYISLSLNDYESVKSSYAKYEAAKLFSGNEGTSLTEETISNYLNIGLNK